MDILEKLENSLNEDRVNVKRMTPEELAKTLLGKYNGDQTRAAEHANILHHQKKQGTPEYEKTQKAFQILSAGLRQDWRTNKFRKEHDNPFVDKMKREAEQQKASTGTMSFKDLSREHKKISSRYEKAGENSTFENIGEFKSGALNKIPDDGVMHIKTKDGQEFLVTKSSYDKGIYTLHDKNGKRFESEKYVTNGRGIKRRTSRISSSRLDGFDVKSHLPDLEGSVTHIIHPDKIRQHMGAERSAKSRDWTDKSNMSDIRKSLYAKAASKTGGDLEAKLDAEIAKIKEKLKRDPRFDVVDAMKNIGMDISNARRDNREFDEIKNGKKLYQTSTRFNRETGKDIPYSYANIGAKSTIEKITRLLSKKKGA